jgi:hypothetical protein
LESHKRQCAELIRKRELVELQRRQEAELIMFCQLKEPVVL